MCYRFIAFLTEIIATFKMELPEVLIRLGEGIWAERETVLMHSHLILAALFPIYIGAHASLRRPPSAAKPKNSESDDEDEDEIKVEPTIEGLTPSDAIMFPVLAGITLAGLYFLIKWMNDPALLNKILGYYFSALGVFGVGKLAADTLNVGTTFIFPTVWSSKGKTYHVEPLLSTQVTGKASKARTLAHREILDISNPFPGWLSTKKFSDATSKKIWALRALLKNHWIFRGYVHNVFHMTSRIQIQDISGYMLGLTAIILYNTWGKVWFLTNLIGFGFCYGTLQLMSPTTFWTGTLVLGGLFIYDITMVFYTPLMITVATTLDVPIKLVFPGMAGKRGSMLGLGDVVLPGIMMALALRFDLYLHYLRKQSSSITSPLQTSELSQSTATDTSANAISKAEYVEATGSWGERFWTWGASTVDGETAADGARFKKIYFNASLIGYIVGMITTLVVLKVFNHAQPALLYLVPGVLIALWGTALVRGELPLMWGYTEDGSIDEPPLEDTKAEVAGAKGTDSTSAADVTGKEEKNQETDTHSLSSFDSSSESNASEVSYIDPKTIGVEKIAKDKAEKEKKEDRSQHIFLFSLSSPRQPSGSPKKANLYNGS